jgi:hypothetical protein
VPAALTPPLALQEEHCWWAVVRSPMRADSVGARFAAAFASVGLSAARTTQLGDTVLVESGPAPIPAWAAGVWASRVVAYPKGDSTHFRHFVAWNAAGAPDSVVVGRSIGVCGAITRAAGVRGIAPREPTGEEGQPVWSRRPAGAGSGT